MTESCVTCEFWGGRKEKAAPLQSASCRLTVNAHGVLVGGTMAHANVELPAMCWLETQAEFYCCQWKEVGGGVSAKSLTGWCHNCGHWFFMGRITHDANCNPKRKRWDTMSLSDKADYVDYSMQRDAYYQYLHELLKDMAKKIEEVK